MPGLDDATVAPPDGLSSGEQASGHRPLFANPRVLASVDSTNRYLADAAREGAPEGSAVVANEQLAGRGRRGRRFVSAPGSALLCSLLFRPRLDEQDFHLVTTVVGLAALDALETLGVAASLKWPNDVVSPRGKLGGILAEVVPGEAPAVIVGVGINLAWPSGFPPPELAAELAAATTVAAEGGRADRDALVDALLEATSRRYRPLVSPRARGAVRREYAERCATLGAEVAVLLEGERVEGRAVELDAEGRLVVETGGERRTFVSGDVVHLRERDVPTVAGRVD